MGDTISLTTEEQRRVRILTLSVVSLSGRDAAATTTRADVTGPSDWYRVARMARTFYDILMVSPRADRQVIAIVYRHLAKRYHPDKDASPEAAARMAELNEAYAVLSDSAKRERYDDQM